MKNRYSKTSKLSEAKIRAVVKCFAADLTALQTAQMCHLNRNTVNRIYRGLRGAAPIPCQLYRLHNVDGVCHSLGEWYQSKAC